MPHLCQVWFAKLLIAWYWVEWVFLKQSVFKVVHGENIGPTNGTRSENFGNLWFTKIALVISAAMQTICKKFAVAWSDSFCTSSYLANTFKGVDVEELKTLSTRHCNRCWDFSIVTSVTEELRIFTVANQAAKSFDKNAPWCVFLHPCKALSVKLVRQCRLQVRHAG